MWSWNKYFGIPTDPLPTFLSRPVPSDILGATFQYNPQGYSGWTVAQVQSSSPTFSITFRPTSSARSFQTFSPVYGMWWNHSSGHFNALPNEAFGYPLATHYWTQCMDRSSEQDSWSKASLHKRNGHFHANTLSHWREDNVATRRGLSSCNAAPRYSKIAPILCTESNTRQLALAVQRTGVF